jgi:hypothetical protein
VPQSMLAFPRSINRSYSTRCASKSIF